MLRIKCLWYFLKYVCGWNHWQGKFFQKRVCESLDEHYLVYLYEEEFILNNFVITLQCEVIRVKIEKPHEKLQDADVNEVKGNRTRQNVGV